MILSPFPYVTPEDLSPRDGFLVKCPNAYRNRIEKRHQKFIMDFLGGKTELDQDPNGFSVYKARIENKPAVVCAVRIDGYCSRKESGRFIGLDFNPIFPLDIFLDTLTRYQIASTQPSRQHLINHHNASATGLVVHDIRTLNADIKQQSEELLDQSSKHSINTKLIGDLSMNIFATSSLISSRLNAHDFLENPESVMQGNPIIMTVYRKFEKAAHMCEVRARKESKKINILGNSTFDVRAHRVFESVPFAVLDNAIKYSPPGSEIVIKFYKNPDGSECVDIESLGPSLEKDEENKVFDFGFRGSNAMTSKPGSGLGLYFVKQVCDYYNFNVSAKSLGQTFMLDGIPMKNFQVKFNYFNVNRVSSTFNQ